MLSQARPDTLPTTVLTGFLGSGKTTLLRRALASPALADTAVIINEIGEIAIDHHLVDFVEGSVLELPGGCLCCAVREDLARTLREPARAARRRRDPAVSPDRHRDHRPRRPGADPVHARRRSDARPLACASARVVTLVDAVHGAETSTASPRRRGRPHSPTRWSSPRPISRRSARSSRAGSMRSTTGPSASSPTDGDRSGCGAVRRRPARCDGSRHAGGAESPPTRTASTPSASCSTARSAASISPARSAGSPASAATTCCGSRGSYASADRPERPAVVQAAQHAMFAPEWLDDWPDERPAQPPRLCRARHPASRDPRRISPSPRPRFWRLDHS